ncbi:MAG: S8 family serine peptidase [Patescibacteria group bacterium]
MRYVVQVQSGQVEKATAALGELKVMPVSRTFNYITIDIPKDLVPKVKALPYVVNVVPEQLSAIRYVAMPVEAKFSEFIHLLLSNPITGPAKAMRFALQADAGKQRIPTSVSRKMVGADVAEADGMTGKGIKIAVLDTGTSYDFLFQGAFAGGKSSMPGQPLPLDEVGHGTHVQTTIAGKPFKSIHGLLLGVAPEATVASFKVLGGGLGLGTTTSILQGLQNALNWGADVINMSLGGPEPDDYLQEPQCQVVAQLTRMGKIICVAAGNDGPGSHTIGCPGNCPEALTVGAVDMDGRICEFSSRGPSKAGFIKPDVVAPGQDILSTSAGYIAAMQVADGPPSLAAISGTSMATPNSTVVALALQYARTRGKDLTTEHIKEAMDLFGEHAGSKNNDYGWGLISYPLLKRYVDERL